MTEAEPPDRTRGMRPAHRAPMPDLDRILAEANELLARAGLPPCESVQPVSDQDTANPVVMGRAADRRYAIKVCLVRPNDLERQLAIANLIAERSGLPIPRHLCCATAPGRLPLVAMEWMQGDQLRVVLPSLDVGGAAELARDWGRSMARFHDTRIDPPKRAGWPTAEEGWAGFMGWLRGRASSLFEELGTKPDLSGTETEAAREFLAEREKAMAVPALPGLVKQADDVRDYLAVSRPSPRVSALLDWEGVCPGDSLPAVTGVFVRLHTLDLEHLWPAFRRGYEEEEGRALPQSPHAEYYLLTRALTAATWHDKGRAIVRRMLAGERLPFGG